MPQFWLSLILLVAICRLNAHGRTFQSNNNYMTSQLAKKDAVRQMDEKYLNLDNIVTIRTPSSAVQDWSLVCQQLCGAALGGATCAPFCKNFSFLPFDVQLLNGKNILDSKQDLLCPELCGLQLGDDVCTCTNYITDDLDVDLNDEQQTNVCAIFCDYNGVTLIGCLPCKSEKEEENENSKKVILKKFQNFSQKQVVPFQATTATTPNWNELCSALCKTGDGGSLCNCDLSPFRI